MVRLDHFFHAWIKLVHQVLGSWITHVAPHGEGYSMGDPHLVRFMIGTYGFERSAFFVLSRFSILVCADQTLKLHHLIVFVHKQQQTEDKTQTLLTDLTSYDSNLRLSSHLL